MFAEKRGVGALRFFCFYYVIYVKLIWRELTDILKI